MHQLLKLIHGLLTAKTAAATRRSNLSRTAWRLVASDRAGRTGSAK